MTNLYGLLNSFDASEFPHTRGAFCAFVQLSQGLGDVSFHIDIRRAVDDRLIHSTLPEILTFNRRTQVLQVVVHFEAVRFDEPGVYFVELYCNNTWVGDVTLELDEVTT